MLTNTWQSSWMYKKTKQLATLWNKTSERRSSDHSKNWCAYTVLSWLIGILSVNDISLLHFASLIFSPVLKLVYSPFWQLSSTRNIYLHVNQKSSCPSRLECEENNKLRTKIGSKVLTEILNLFWMKKTLNYKAHMYIFTFKLAVYWNTKKFFW